MQVLLNSEAEIGDVGVLVPLEVIQDSRGILIADLLLVLEI